MMVGRISAEQPRRQLYAMDNSIGIGVPSLSRMGQDRYAAFLEELYQAQHDELPIAPHVAVDRVQAVDAMALDAGDLQRRTEFIGACNGR
jgi:hypothetical protein